MRMNVGTIRAFKLPGGLTTRGSDAWFPCGHPEEFQWPDSTTQLHGPTRMPASSRAQLRINRQLTSNTPGSDGGSGSVLHKCLPSPEAGDDAKTSRCRHSPAVKAKCSLSLEE